MLRANSGTVRLSVQGIQNHCLNCFLRGKQKEQQGWYTILTPAVYMHSIRTLHVPLFVGGTRAVGGIVSEWLLDPTIPLTIIFTKMAHLILLLRGEV